MKLNELLIITIFKNIIEDPTIRCFIDFLKSLDENCEEKTLKFYSEFISRLYNAEIEQDLYKYLKHTIYIDDNIIAKNAANVKNNDAIYKAAANELIIFDELLKYDYFTVKKLVQDKLSNISYIADKLPEFYTNNKESFKLDDIILSYKTKGYGIFADNKAFKFNHDKKICPIKDFKAMTFDELKNYKYQQEIILKNTKAFVEGKEANNILLYGDRGCGKSSTVKALINEFADYNLKIIQITKESFIYLSDLYEQLKKLPLKFIIFADDISFDENDKNFSTIKAVLEGSLSERPQNAIIYATTNRMHLVKESFSSREGSELHLNDTIDEMVSLSDRFGIMLTFSSLTKTEYLDIVGQIAKDLSVEINDKLFREAEMFAALKAIRTPRVARQFITDYMSNM